MPENLTAMLRTELAAARQDLEKADAALQRADECAAVGDTAGAWNRLTAANSLLRDTRRVMNMLIRDVEKAAQPYHRRYRDNPRLAREKVGV